MLEAVVGLPDQLFYNTGIYTYIWIVTNRKSAKRQGKVQLINATDFAWKMKKSQTSEKLGEGDAQNIQANPTILMPSPRSMPALMTTSNAHSKPLLPMSTAQKIKKSAIKIKRLSSAKILTIRIWLFQNHR